MEFPFNGTTLSDKIPAIDYYARNGDTGVAN